MGISDTNTIELNTEKESRIKPKPEIKSNIEKSVLIISENEASCRDSWKDRKSKKRKKHKKQKRLKNEAENVQALVPVPVSKTKQGKLIYFKIEIQTMLASMLFHISFITAGDFNYPGIIP